MEKHEVSFSTLVLSLGSSCLMALGLAPDPSGKTEKNIDMAKFNIDLIEMLKEKTKGNLTSEETQFLEFMLSDLQLKFVETKK